MFRYEGKVLDEGETGVDYSEMLGLLGGEYRVALQSVKVLLSDDDRAYVYVKFETGDEMSRRAKFAFITWIGPAVTPLKKAKVSTDKAFMKNVWTVSQHVDLMRQV